MREMKGKYKFFEKLKHLLDRNICGVKNLILKLYKLFELNNSLSSIMFPKKRGLKHKEISLASSSVNQTFTLIFSLF